ncbi:hypothetical protein MKW98_004282 [Papaver atlanticum]|uniref:Prolyl 4-hydroxylase alpha subunit domain-containing protein n=1 Tax=Papaver atlanticum TaxID=357466 RepID=A0AAD4T6I8_9MAGN|nr:hypothetical protein MKW98_004282 [Papaver atlanticum]
MSAQSSPGYLKYTRYMVSSLDLVSSSFHRAAMVPRLPSLKLQTDQTRKRKSISVEAAKTTMAERKKEDSKKKSKWPKISPKTDLQINLLKETHLFTVPNFFTSVESKGFVQAAELMGFTHQGSLGPTRGEAFRDNDRISVDDPVLAQTIWESGLNKFFTDIKIRGKVAVGLNPNIRFYRYKTGQRFGRHIDESVELGDGWRTYYTLLIYLSGGGSGQKTKTEMSSQKDASVEPLVGGETVFYGPRRGVVAEVAPAEGMALLHLHGDNCMLHEARNVAKGVKYVFRSDVIFA